MKKLLTLAVLILTTSAAFAQNKMVGRVFDSQSKEPLPFVNITINNTREGVSADIDGRFEIDHHSAIKQLTFSFVGYTKKSVQISAGTAQPLNIYLVEQTELLNEVEVVAGENPAHRIIKNATENRAKNDPENLQSFSYNSYNKFVFTMEKDSLASSDELFADSTMQEVEAFMNKQHLMMMESATERKFMQPNRDNEVIVANRVSGLKNPTFVLLANQLQSFSFYEDFVQVVGIDYLNPISKGSTRKYFFLLQDTLHTGQDSTFVISFQPKKGANFKGLKGLLYITTDGWAIKNVVAEPVEQEDFSVEIQQLYKKFEGSWFPYQMNYDFVFNSIEIEGIKPLGIGRTYLSDVKINPPLTKDDFSRIAVKVENEATKREDDYWARFRKDDLTNKEKETYRVIDSVGKAENFEGKLRWLTALAEGKVRWGILDFPLKHLMRYNLYEGFRLGFGAETNQNLLKWASVGGYFAYGFGDKVWKYGYYGSVTLHDETNLKLGGGYRYDIFESGGQHWIDQPQRTILSQGNTRLFFIEQFDQLSEAYGYVTWHPLPNLHTKVQLSRENRYMPGDYYFRTTDAEGNTVYQNGFVAGVLRANVRWAPNEKYMQGPFGRRPMNRAFPVVKVQFAKGVDGLLDGTLDFERIDLQVRHDFKTRVFGVTTIVAEGGKVFGDVPYSYLYNGRANRPLSYDGWLLVADRFSFETMWNNEFLNDEYVHFMFRHNFQSRFLKVGTWAPEVEVLVRGLWGTMQNPDSQKGIDFSDARHGFYETGLEINKLYQSLGVGAYYRFGPYQLADMSQNWAIKLSYAVTLF